jgi:hypothetical protein
LEAVRAKPAADLLLSGPLALSLCFNGIVKRLNERIKRAEKEKEKKIEKFEYIVRDALKCQISMRLGFRRYP